MVFFAFTFHLGGGGLGFFFPFLFLLQPFLVGRRQRHPQQRPRDGRQASMMSWYSVMAVAVVLLLPHLLQWCMVGGLHVPSFLSHPMLQPLVWTVFMGLFAACVIHSRFFHDVNLPRHPTGRSDFTTTTATDEDVKVARMIRELPVIKVHACVDDLQSFNTSELKDIYRYYQCMNLKDDAKDTWDRCLVEKSEVISEIEKLMALRRHENTTMCSICYEEYTVGETVRYLPECGHIYHIECIDQWCLTCPSNSSASALTCPLCKRPICK